MDILNKRINRKTFIGLAVITLIILTFTKILLASPNENEVTGGMLLAGVLIVIYIMSIHLRCNDINGRTNIANSAMYILLSLIPIVSLIILIYLSTKKGEDVNNVIEKNDISEDGEKITDAIDELQSRYKNDLAKNDDGIDVLIGNELYTRCNEIQSLKNVVIENNISQDDIVKIYRNLKCDDVLWDDKTGKYLPFVSILTPENLVMMHQKINFPDNTKKRIVMTSSEKHSGKNNTSNASKLPGLFQDIKKTWILIFLVTSIAMLLYPPYHTVIPNRGEEFAGYNIVGEIPAKVSSGKKRFTSIDYTTLAFHEVICGVVCCAGYTLTMMVRKK